MIPDETLYHSLPQGVTVCLLRATTHTTHFWLLVWTSGSRCAHRFLAVQVMQQEGWHYELEDKNEPLTYKGVVFNEMKGVYSSPDSLHGRTCQQVPI